MSLTTLPDDALASIFDALSKATGWTGTPPHAIPALARASRRFDTFYRTSYISSLHLVDVPSNTVARALRRFPRVNNLNLFFYGRANLDVKLIFSDAARGAGITKLALEVASVSPDELQRIVHYCPHLVSLKLQKQYCSNAVGCSNETVGELADRLNGTLQVLSLSRGGRNICDSGGTALGRLAKLVKLDLSWCEKLGDATFLSLSQLRGLRHLNLTGTNVTDESARPMFSALTSLTVLDISNCVGVSTMIVDVLPQSLEFLYSHNTRILQDASSIPDMSHLDKLRELHARNCSSLFDWGSVATLTHQLRVLNVSATPISDNGAYDAMSRFHLLERLDVGGCDVADDSARAIARNLGRLRELRMYRTAVTDFGAHCIAEGCGRKTLKVVDFQWCPLIRHKSATQALLTNAIRGATVWL